MKIRKIVLLIATLTVTASVSNFSYADDVSLQQRVETLERIVKGQGLLNLLTRVDQLQNDVKTLKGENEDLQHKLDQMKKSQQQMYIDLDNKLSQKTVSTKPTTSSTSPDATSASVSNTPKVISGTSAVAASTSNDGEADYQAALQSVRSGQYQQAIQSFEAFSKKYPNSSYLPNVYYWEGAVKYILLQYAEANKLFEKVINEYPKNAKAPDAMLKLGFSQQQMGNDKQSTQTLNQLIKQYPNSEAAKYAKARLASNKE